MLEPARTSRVEIRFATAVFTALLITHAILVLTGWRDASMPGNEFRQVQTAIAARYAQKEGYFINYPMPLLGSPWSAPMEFPFYQWAVAETATRMGWPIVQSGRAVSLVCFYALLPAIWLLLGRAGLPKWQRGLALGLILACPVYIFYSRGVTIEPLALLCSLWFLAALVEAVAAESIPWLIVAIVMGIAAGLEKITTWMLYLIPVGCWMLATAVRAIRARESPQGPRWRALMVVGAILLLPAMTAIGWVRFSDALKADHPGSAFLVSKGMMAHNFGTLAVRLSARFWSELNHMWTFSAGWPGLLVLLAAAALWAGRWRWWAFGCLGLFFAAPMIFPILYSWHDYYFYANTVLLALGAGFVFAGWRERFRAPWPAWCLLAACLSLQYSAYFRHVFPVQKQITFGGSGLTNALRDLLDDDNLIVIAGHDWHGFVPFYSGKRALMIRRNEEHRLDLIKPLFDHLRDDFVAVLLLAGEQRDNRELLAAAVNQLGIDPRPIATFRDSVIYAHRAVRWEYMHRLHASSYPEMVPDTDTSSPPGSSEGWIRGRQHLAIFQAMHPQPHRYRVPFSLNSILPPEGRVFNAHAETTLWFQVPPGPHEVAVEFGLIEGSYADSSHPLTDGIGLDIIELTAEGTERVVFERLLDPVHQPKDRGTLHIECHVTLSKGSELLVRTTPGARGDRSFDWSYIKSIDIR